MYSSSFITVIAIFLGLGGCAPVQPSNCTLELKTTSGVFTGIINSTAPNVRQFLGVPFALPPTGSRRWLPPFTFQSDASFAANNIGPACPQLPVTSGIFNHSAYSPKGGNETEFFPQNGYSEDCLTLNVWTPQNPKKALPVFVWFFGGGWTQGGTNSLYFNPQSWVQRTQDYIVVTVNFRSNILGFPNAPELVDQNLGLLDQRLALEWVRENIAIFGGDTLRIVDWGQSGGAIAVDVLNFTYPLDPIVSGMIMDSGTVTLPPSNRITTDTAQKNFTTVAKAFGCESADSQVDCLRMVSSQDLQEYLFKDSAQNFTFTPVVDERIVFSNYTRQYELGALSSVPAIIGSDANEVNVFGVIPGYEAVENKASNSSFLCNASATTSQLRQSQSRTTYRYQYNGNFTNISPPGYTGASHASELPLIFGTAGQYHGNNTAYEDVVSRTLQDLWLDFATDPENGLRDSGWGSYGEGKAVVLGGEGNPMAEIAIGQLDGICSQLDAASVDI
jgi:carboxylesterase type B